jgi:hypothetical protein
VKIATRGLDIRKLSLSSRAGVIKSLSPVDGSSESHSNGPQLGDGDKGISGIPSIMLSRTALSEIAGFDIVVGIDYMITSNRSGESRKASNQ